VTCVDCEDYPEITCPKCGHEFPDMDGFGFLFCPACKHCKHPSRTDGVCGLCGEPHGRE
jgi:hypothetical protein